MLFPPEYPGYAQAGQAEYRVPAASALAQCIQESSGGKYIPKGSNNILGIQRLSGFPFVESQSFEFIGGKRVPKIERFAKFATVAECFMEHAKLIATNPVYAAAMAHLPPKGQNPTVAQCDAFMLAMGPHYATAPHYAQDVIGIEVADNLYPYDILVTVAHDNDLHVHNALPGAAAAPAIAPAPAPVSPSLTARFEAVKATLATKNPQPVHESLLQRLEAVVAEWL